MGRTCTAGSVPYEPRVGGRREQDALLVDTPVPVTVRTGPSARAAAGTRQREEEEGRVAELGPDTAGVG